MKGILALVLLCSLAECSAMEEDERISLMPASETPSQSAASFQGMSSSAMQLERIDDLMERGGITEVARRVLKLEDDIFDLKVDSRAHKELSSHYQNSQKWVDRKVGMLEGIMGVNLCYNTSVTCATCTLGCTILGIFIYTLANGNITFNA